MKAVRFLALAGALGLAAWSCGDDESPTGPEPALNGSYQGRYTYTLVRDGDIIKSLGQAVFVDIDDTLFLMRRDPSTPREFCDISAPCTHAKVVDIDCPPMQYDCMENEHPCGRFSIAWKGDSLKLAQDYRDTLNWLHVKRLHLKRDSR